MEAIYKEAGAAAQRKCLSRQQGKWKFRAAVLSDLKCNYTSCYYSNWEGFVRIKINIILFEMFNRRYPNTHLTFIGLFTALKMFHFKIRVCASLLCVADGRVGVITQYLHISTREPGPHSLGHISCQQVCFHVGVVLMLVTEEQSSRMDTRVWNIASCQGEKPLPQRGHRGTRFWPGSSSSRPHITSWSYTCPVESKKRYFPVNKHRVYWKHLFCAVCAAVSNNTTAYVNILVGHRTYLHFISPVRKIYFQALTRLFSIALRWGKCHLNILLVGNVRYNHELARPASVWQVPSRVGGAERGSSLCPPRQKCIQTISSCKLMRDGVVRLDWLQLQDAGGGGDGDLNSGFCPVLKKLGQMPSRAPSLTDGWLPGMMGLCLRCQPEGTPTKSGWGVGADFDRSWTKKNVFKWSAETFHVMNMNAATTSLCRWRPESPTAHSPLWSQAVTMHGEPGFPDLLVTTASTENHMNAVASWGVSLSRWASADVWIPVSH